MEAALRGLDPSRKDRDEAEITLNRLKHDSRTGPEDALNISLALVGIVQRRGDHHGALKQLDALVIDEASEGILHALNLRAVSLSQLGEHRAAGEIFDALLDSHASKTSISGLWQMEAGRAYHLAGRTSDAIDATKKALSFFESSNDAEHVARAKSNLAIFMLNSEAEEEVTEAEAALENACDIKIGLGDTEGASTNFSQLSMHHFAHNRFEKAIAYGRKDLKLSRFVGNDVMTAATLNNMGVIYCRVLQLAEARNSVREAEEIGRRLENPHILQTSAALLRAIEEVGRTTGEQKIKVGKQADCACKSGKKYIDCCGRADHEPVALRMPIGGPSEDIDDLKAALQGTGLRLVQLDYAMRESKESRNRIAWSKMKAHDGWFEIFELPDMATSI